MVDLERMRKNPRFGSLGPLEVVHALELRPFPLIIDIVGPLPCGSTL